MTVVCDETRVLSGELRFVGGRQLSGIVLRYGDVAVLPWGEERIEQGAFGLPHEIRQGDCILNFQHERATPLCRTQGGGLELADSPTALAMRAQVPRTQAGNDALELVRTKVLRGLSVEMAVTKERFDGDTRIIERAKLVNIGLVDRPAYSESKVAVRHERNADRARLARIRYWY